MSEREPQVLVERFDSFNSENPGIDGFLITSNGITNEMYRMRDANRLRLRWPLKWQGTDITSFERETTETISRLMYFPTPSDREQRLNRFCVAVLFKGADSTVILELNDPKQLVEYERIAGYEQDAVDTIYYLMGTTSNSILIVGYQGDHGYDNPPNQLIETTLSRYSRLFSPEMIELAIKNNLNSYSGDERTLATPISKELMSIGRNFVEGLYP